MPTHTITPDDYIYHGGWTDAIRRWIDRGIVPIDSCSTGTAYTYNETDMLGLIRNVQDAYGNTVTSLNIPDGYWSQPITTTSAVGTSASTLIVDEFGGYEGQVGNGLRKQMVKHDFDPKDVGVSDEELEEFLYGD